MSPGNVDGGREPDPAAAITATRPDHHEGPGQMQVTAYVAGLRRRRAASWRCPPLDCGCPRGPHRDPLDCLSGSFLTDDECEHGVVVDPVDGFPCHHCMALVSS